MNLSSDDYVFWWYHYISMDCQLLRTSSGLRALNSSWTYFSLHLTSIFICAVPDTLGTPTWHLWYVSPPLPPNPRFVNWRGSLNCFCSLWVDSWGLFVFQAWSRQTSEQFPQAECSTTSAKPTSGNRSPLHYGEYLLICETNMFDFKLLWVFPSIVCLMSLPTLPFWCLAHRFNNSNLQGQRP